MIDTISVNIPKRLTEAEVERVNNLSYILDKHSKINEKSTTLRIKVNKSSTTSISEALEATQELRDITNTNVFIKRFDLAVDSSQNVTDRFLSTKLYLYLYELLLHGKIANISETKLNEKLVNIKVRNSKTEISLYDCSDKYYRKNINSRLEHRILKIQSRKNAEEVITKELEYIKNNINSLENNYKELLTELEEYLVENLTMLFAEEMEDSNNVKLYFKDFIHKYNHLFLTKRILEEFMNVLSLEQNCSNIIREYKRKYKNGFNFVSKKDIFNITRDFKRDIKEILKK